MDLVQALRTARLLLGSRLESITLYGFSFGGGMALMAGALDKDVDFMVVGQPTLGWHSERLRLSKAGSSAELNRYLACKSSDHDAVMQTLAYFDTMHFAARLATPMMVGIGLDDDVVPSRSVMAVTGHVTSEDLELRILPVSHSDDPRESLWARFDDEWIAMARRGIPAGLWQPRAPRYLFDLTASGMRKTRFRRFRCRAKIPGRQPGDQR